MGGFFLIFAFFSIPVFGGWADCAWDQLAPELTVREQRAVARFDREMISAEKAQGRIPHGRLARRMARAADRFLKSFGYETRREGGFLRIRRGGANLALGLEKQSLPLNLAYDADFAVENPDWLFHDSGYFQPANHVALSSWGVRDLALRLPNPTSLHEVLHGVLNTRFHEGGDSLFYGDFTARDGKELSRFPADEEYRDYQSIEEVLTYSYELYLATTLFRQLRAAGAKAKVLRRALDRVEGIAESQKQILLQTRKLVRDSLIALETEGVVEFGFGRGEYRRSLARPMPVARMTTDEFHLTLPVVLASGAVPKDKTQLQAWGARYRAELRSRLMNLDDLVDRQLVPLRRGLRELSQQPPSEFQPDALRAPYLIGRPFSITAHPK